MAQTVKNPPAMWETWVQSLGWEDPLEKGMAPTPVFWPGKFHGLQQGRMATEAIKALLKDKLTVYDHPPMLGKDYNEDLLARQQRFQEKKRQAPQEER